MMHFSFVWFGKGNGSRCRTLVVMTGYCRSSSMSLKLFVIFLGVELERDALL